MFIPLNFDNTLIFFPEKGKKNTDIFFCKIWAKCWKFPYRSFTCTHFPKNGFFFFLSNAKWVSFHFPYLYTFPQTRIFLVIYTRTDFVKLIVAVLGSLAIKLFLVLFCFLKVKKFQLHFKISMFCVKFLEVSKSLNCKVGTAYGTRGKL